ncbi:MAG: LPS-assembly lipoprotein [Psychromonas sp.]|jgi:LPS-assembly lipoprotein|uniref:LPS-assembly lipoprotein LptE n=1 Tax=Psychromonas sp. TaxID=1884585 RepID=UPI0039E57EEC
MQSTVRSFFYAKITLIFLSAVLISGCGFHLKNNNGLIEKYPKIYLQSTNTNDELIRFIKTRLRGAGIELLSQPEAGVAILKVYPERRSSRIISLYVNAQNAEKEKSYNVNYSIQSPGYQTQEFSINLYRDFLENSSQALAKSREAEILTKELRGIAADSIIATMLSLENKK